MLEINKAKYIDQYNIQISFSDGNQGIANLKQTIFSDKREIFSRLRNQKEFKQFKINHNTLVWFDELDLAPEYLYFLAFKENEKLKNQFIKWGYIN